MLHIEPKPDETGAPDDTASVRGVPTLYFRDASRSILSSNTSPDVPLNRSVNPYRGCEHGCIYCYARPTHEYLGLSAGLDFETRIFVKPRAPELLRAELSRRSWTPQVLAMSGVTDPYQPIERRLQLTRGCLAVLAEFRNPVGVITKSALVTRDLDLLAELATHRCVSVTLSVTTLEEDVRRAMEPRASTAERRFEAIARLRDRGVPAGVNIAPVVPGLTDHEIVPILKQAAQAGVSRHAKCYRASYRRATTRVTHQGGWRWGESEWDHKQFASIWDGCGNATRTRRGGRRASCWMRCVR